MIFMSFLDKYNTKNGLKIMSHGNSHTLYVLNDMQNMDLVLTTEGMKVDNRPMNQKKLVVHKGFNNTLSFFVRNRDRVLQNLSSKTLYASVINPNTKRRVLYKQLTLVSGGTTGEATLNLNIGDLTNLDKGLYQIAISESADGVTEYPLYANQNDRIITDLEIMSSLEFEPIPTQENTFTQTSNTALGDASNVFVTSALFGNQDSNYQHSEHTVALYLSNFVGNVYIQGSALESTPSQETDWYNIDIQGDAGQPGIPYSTSYNGIDPFNFSLNTNWIRIKAEPTSGTIDKVLLRN